MMTGSEHVLNVYSGKSLIATLTLCDDQLSLQYTKDWQSSGFALSPHLPLSGDIAPANLQRFLRNQLPEGDGLDALLANFRLSRSNTFGLIRALGLDTPGSFWFSPAGQSIPTTASLRLFENGEIARRLDQRDHFSIIIWDGKPRLSVAGVQDKINVVINADHQMGLGEGTLTSTHILKFEKQKLSHLVINEYFSMQLAKQCSLEVANVKLLRFGNHPALLIQRFDRKLISTNEVKRRHMIDGCQALNLSPEYKYERNFGSGRDVAHIREGASLTKLFGFANACANPAETKDKMIDWVLFNLLIFNFDAHGKNISFFVGKNGLSLTPFYDLVNINMYPEFDHELAMALGDEFNADAITAYQLADFAESCHISRSYLAKKLRKISSVLNTALDASDDSFACDAEEKHYLMRYKSMVHHRCVYLNAQADDIIEVTL